MQRVCVSIGSASLDDALAAVDRAAPLADVVEIRLDHLSVPVVSPFMTAVQRPLLFTNRPEWEGGGYCGPEEERIAPLCEALCQGASYVDLELLAPLESRQVLLREVEKSAQGRLILSWHQFQGTPSFQELVGRMALMQDAGADIGKIVTTAHGPADVRSVLRLLEEAARLNFPLIAFCMGRAGVISRVASVELGGYMTYCAAHETEITAPGQLSVTTLRRIESLMGGEQP